jgi:hypothetical protein
MRDSVNRDFEGGSIVILKKGPNRRGEEDDVVAFGECRCNLPFRRKRQLLIARRIMSTIVVPSNPTAFSIG